jgi:hypothetical protein
MIIGGTTSHGDELTGDFGDGMEAMSHSDFGSFGLFAGNCPRGILGVLQHYLPVSDIKPAAVCCFSIAV